MPSAPACSAFSTASRTSACAPGLKVASAITAIFFPFTVRVTDATTGSEIVARVIVTVRREPWGPFPWTVIFTSVPGVPLISSIAFSAGRPRSWRPLTATITSPAASPARAAGEESNTCAISRPLRSGPTDTPIPVKCGGELNSRNSLGVR